MARSVSRRDLIAGAVASVTVPAFNAAYAQQPKIHHVKITGFAYVPDRLIVSVGDTVRWTNTDLAAHTATADAFGWDTGEIARGESADIVITSDMEVSYFCAYHPHMKATLVLD